MSEFSAFSSRAEWEAAMTALSWQLEAGVDDILEEYPIDRFELAPVLPKPAGGGPKAQKAPPTAPSGVGVGRAHKNDTTTPSTPAPSALEQAQRLADACLTLPELSQAIANFDLCELKKGARKTVFADGNPNAKVLILGEAPGSDEDIQGLPFVGRAGKLLDRMFAVIGLSRTSEESQKALYITNVMPWRPPGNREPDPEEIALMLPFVHRHIALVDPQVIVVMGNTPLYALSGARGILRARGKWGTALGRAMLPMAHPAYLLRNPIAKRDAWADLLLLSEHLSTQDIGHKADEKGNAP